MNGWTIGEVARRAGLQTSAIRYYESAGLLTEPMRRNGRRIYDPSILRWLALIRVARKGGFSISEVRTLLTGFSTATPASERWRQLATLKLAEIRKQIDQLDAMQQVVERLLDCECPTLEDCGIRMEGLSNHRDKNEM